MPAKKTKSSEILIVYGQQSSIEQMYVLAKELNDYGAVTMADLPGFGGMHSFYKIGEKPSLDNFADYVAALVKLKFSRRKLNIVGVSYGFAVVTRMLQKYPEIGKKVGTLVSIEGFVHYQDFKLKHGDALVLRGASRLLSARVPAWLTDKVILRPSVMRITYNIINPKNKTKDIKAKVAIWKQNNLRTYMASNASSLKLNLCNIQVDLDVYQIMDNQHKLFNPNVLKQHLKVIFNKVYVITDKPKSRKKTASSAEQHYLVPLPTKVKQQLAK